MTIASASMLVELNISVWTANKVDKGVSRKVATDNNATASDVGLFRKNLMAGSTLRKEIADYAAACRLWHNTRTLPWSDRGPRLLATSLFFDYKQQANLRRDYFDTKVAEFIDQYPALRVQAQQHLGDLYDPNDYPSVDEVRAKFGFRLVFSPVPESGDFRVDLPAMEIAEMRQQYDAAFNDRLAEAMREPWNKMHECITRMSGKLKLAIDTDGEKMRWHDTFITNATDLCDMLTHLNITKDPELERARRALENVVRGVDIDDVKEDSTLREDMKAKLDAILSDYRW